MAFEISECEYKRLSAQFSTLYDFIRALIYSRCITKELDKSENKSKFWKATQINHLQVASIFWCRVFGTDSQECHWKKTLENQDEFRKSVYENTGFDYDSFCAYRKEMMDFRNEFIAHMNVFKLPQNVPDFEPALKTVVTAHKWLMSITNNYKVIYKGPLDISKFIGNLSEEADELISMAVSASKKLPEHH